MNHSKVFCGNSEHFTLALAQIRVSRKVRVEHSEAPKSVSFVADLGKLGASRNLASHFSTCTDLALTGWQKHPCASLRINLIELRTSKELNIGGRVPQSAAHVHVRMNHLRQNCRCLIACQLRLFMALWAAITAQIFLIDRVNGAKSISTFSFLSQSCLACSLQIASLAIVPDNRLWLVDQGDLRHRRCFCHIYLMLLRFFKFFILIKLFCI